MPSGVHAEAACRGLTRFVYLPSAGATKTPGRAPPVVNVRRSPSGDQAGCSIPLPVAAVLSARTSPPARRRTRRRRPFSVMETKATRAPSGDTIGHRSGLWAVVRRRSVPALSRTQTRAALPRPRTKNRLPSRPTDGSPSGSVVPTTRVGAPPFTPPTEICQMSKPPPPPPPPPPLRFDENSSVLPSLDHAGSRSQSGPDVTRVHAPSGDTIQRSPRTLRAKRPSAA